MDSIRELVPSSYHSLIFSGQPDLCASMSNASRPGHKKTGKKLFDLMINLISN